MVHRAGTMSPTRLAILVASFSVMLILAPVDAAPKRRKVVVEPAEWRNSEDHIPQIRATHHHQVKHAGMPHAPFVSAQEPTEPASEETAEYSQALIPTTDTEKLPEENATSTYNYEAIPEKQDAVVEIMSVDELKVLSPMLTLPKQEQKKQYASGENKEQWSIIVKQRPSPVNEQTRTSSEAISSSSESTPAEPAPESAAPESADPGSAAPETATPESAAPESVPEKVEPISSEIDTDETNKPLKEQVMPILEEVYEALASHPESMEEEEFPVIDDEKQINVTILCDDINPAYKPCSSAATNTLADTGVLVKDIKVDIINDVSDAIKGGVTKFQNDLIASKNKFEERFQAVREGIKEQQAFIQEAVQQKKDKINDYIDKFVFKINKTTEIPPTTDPTGPTVGPTEVPPVTDPPPGPPGARFKPLQQGKFAGIGGVSYNYDGGEVTGKKAQVLEPESEVDGDEKQTNSNILQQAQQFIQNIQNQFTQNGGSNAPPANDGTQGAVQPGSQNVFQQVGQAFQTQIQNFQNQFRPQQDAAPVNEEENAEPTPSGDILQQFGQAVQTGIQNVQTSVQGGFQNIQDVINQQQAAQDVGAGAESGTVNPQNILQQFGTAVQNGIQNVQNAFSPPPAQSAPASDTPANERPNILQQGLQNFNNAVVIPVQQLFQQSQTQQSAAKPVVEEADVLVLQGTTEADYDEQNSIDGAPSVKQLPLYGKIPQKFDVNTKKERFGQDAGKKLVKTEEKIEGMVKKQTDTVEQVEKFLADMEKNEDNPQKTTENAKEHEEKVDETAKKTDQFEKIKDIAKESQKTEVKPKEDSKILEVAEKVDESADAPVKVVSYDEFVENLKSKDVGEKPVASVEVTDA